MSVQFHGTPPACVEEPAFQWRLAEALQVRHLYVEDSRNYDLLRKFVGGILKQRRRHDLTPEDVISRNFVEAQPSKAALTCLLVESATGASVQPHPAALEVPDDVRFGRGGQRKSPLTPPARARLRFYVLPKDCLLAEQPDIYQDEPSTWWIAIVARFRPARFFQTARLQGIRQDESGDELEDESEEHADLEHLTTLARVRWEGWLLHYVARKARYYDLYVAKEDSEDLPPAGFFTQGSELDQEPGHSDQMESPTNSPPGTGPAAPDLMPMRWVTAFLPSMLCCLESLRGKGLTLAAVVKLFALGTPGGLISRDQGKHARKVAGDRTRDLAAALAYIRDPDARAFFKDIQADLAAESDTRQAFDLLIKFHLPESAAGLAQDQQLLAAWKQEVRAHFDSHATASIKTGVSSLCGDGTPVEDVLDVLAVNELGRFLLREWCPALPAFPTSWQTPRHQAWHGLSDTQKQNLLERSLRGVIRECRKKFPTINPQHLVIFEPHPSSV